MNSVQCSIHLCSILKAFPRQARIGLVYIVISLLMSSCAGFKPAQMKLEEVFYIAVASGEHTNYFRITVKANSVLGIAAYESGWFSSEAVDSLYGSGNSDSPKQDIIKENLNNSMDTAFKDAYQAYLDAAKNKNTSEEEIAKLLRAVKRVRAVPGDGIPLPVGAKEIEYDPISNRTLLHSGEKFVIAFTSNPNDVLKNIKSVAQSKQTGATILKLSQLLVHQNKEDSDVIQVEKVTASRFAALLSTRLNAAHTSIDIDSEVSETNVEKELQRLRNDLQTLLTLSESMQ